MGLKLSNNATSRLAGNITSTDTVINLVSGEGQLFPSLSAGDWFPATLIKSTGQSEIIRVTARNVDILTVTRGQEGTLAVPFNAGDRLDIRLTAGIVTELEAQLTQRVQSVLDLFPTGFGPLPWSRANPPGGWIWSDGRILLPDTPHGALRAAYIADGFPYGQDGSGNPRIPDMAGRIPAGRDNLSGAAAGRLTAAGAGFDGTQLGAAGGAQAVALTAAQLAAHAHGISDPGHAHGVSDPGHSHGIYDPGHHHPFQAMSFWNGVNNDAPGGGMGASFRDLGTDGNHTGISINGAYSNIGIIGAGTGISVQNAGGGAAHSNTQPTLVLNYIVKV